MKSVLQRQFIIGCQYMEKDIWYYVILLRWEMRFFQKPYAHTSVTSRYNSSISYECVLTVW